MISSLPSGHESQVGNPPRPAPPAGPSSWGTWAGSRYYSLEVVQHPLRARMCGFGDKDRRPVAPATVVKLVVHNDDNTLADAEDVDLTFFIATVDLWSEDGMREMNLVLNTSNTERNAHITPRRRRRTNSAMTVSSPDTPDFAAGVNIAPISEGQASDSQCYEEPEEITTSGDVTSSPVVSYNQHHAFSSHIPSSSSGYPQGPDPMSFNPSNPYGPPTEPPSSSWHYSSPIESVPSQMSREQASAPYTDPQLASSPSYSRPVRKSTTSSLEGANVDPNTYTSENQWANDEAIPARQGTYQVATAWDTYGQVADISAAPHHVAESSTSSDYSSQPVWTEPQSSLAGAIPLAYPSNAFAQSTSEARPQTQPLEYEISYTVSPIQYPQSSQPSVYPPQPPSEAGTLSPTASRHIPQPVLPTTPTTFQPQPGQFGFAQPTELSPPPLPPPLPNLPTTPGEAVSLPRHTYIRTLVGPVASNSFRLLDENQKVGNFFIFQDLSVRTEGTFRLRVRLMNIGMPPVPSSGALQINPGISSIIAQTFSEPFVVFSAKRFPGVPDNSSLSIAFADQGIKLPLRSKNGEAKSRHRKRRREQQQGSCGDDST